MRVRESFRDKYQCRDREIIGVPVSQEETQPNIVPTSRMASGDNLK